MVWLADALRCFDASTGEPTADSLLPRAQLVAALGGALLELGRWDEAEQPLSAALASLEGSAAGESEAGRVVMASLRLSLAAARMVSGRLPMAPPLLRAALASMPDSGADVLRVRVQILLGGAMSALGSPEAGLPHLSAAAATLDRPEHEERFRLRSALHVNTGYAYIMLGRHDDACRSFEAGIALFDGLVLAGRPARRSDRARALMNLGSAHVRAGRPQQALPCYQPALADCDAAIRDARQPAAAMRHRATRGAILMNWGYCLFVLNDDRAAAVALQRAARSHAGLVQAYPHLRDDLARTWVNQAHLATRAGRLRRAAELYQKGLSSLGAALQGRPYLQSEHANAGLGLARVRLLQGHTEQAATLFEAAMTTLSTLSRAGQLPLAWTWLEAWGAQFSALLQRELSLRRRTQAQDGGVAAAFHRDVLLRVLAQPPRRGLGNGSVPLQALQAAADLIEQGSESFRSVAPPVAGFADLMAAYLGYVIGCLGDVLADSEPGWLAQHAGELHKAAARLRDIAAAQPQASQRLADWFLHTRGLRAQRSALTQGESTPVVALRDLLRRLRRLEDEMLGESTAASKAEAPHLRAPGLLIPSLSRPTPAQDHERAAAWQDLHDRVESLRQELVETGHLPPTLRLGAAGVAALVAPHSALILLAQQEGQRVLAVVLRRPGPGPVATSHVVVDQHPDLAHFSCSSLLRLARHSLGQSTHGDALRGAPDTTAIVASAQPSHRPEDLDLFALDLFGSIWHRTVLPLLESLAEEGCNEVGLVPSDGLHLVPWTHFAQTAAPPGCSVEVYPSCGAWARSRPPADADADAMLPPRWAVAAWSGQGGARPLPWVDVERCLSARLWQDLSGPSVLLQGTPPSADGVGALVCMGHGSVLDSNAAHAGLAMAGGVVLGAHDLHQVRSCRRVLLSACMLGCIDEAFGEPLGFLSSCFDYRTGFGAGWLTEVPDSSACWASLAMQFALRQAYATPANGPVVWSRVVGQTRLEILDGAWPDGFGTWLEAELPSALRELAEHGLLPQGLALDQPVPLAPPAALRRVLPWAVAFGH